MIIDFSKDYFNYKEQYQILLKAESILRDYFYSEELNISLDQFADCMRCIAKTEREINEYIVMIEDGIIQDFYADLDSLPF